MKRVSDNDELESARAQQCMIIGCNRLINSREENIKYSRLSRKT